ncbi:MAG TPA: hypothetical protein VEX68_12945 [Bryobacteraceae bacterium]|nr:hypothetical protein [Bryobacteraceae bacterium]
MRRLAILLLVSMASGEIIDRIAVTVEKRVITESEIWRQIRIAAFLNDQEPDFSSGAKRTMADRLVEQVLIRRELETSSRVPTSIPTPSTYQQIKARFKTDEEYKQALAKYRIADDDVREALAWQAALLEFIDQRFRPGVQIPQSEIREHYDQQVAQNPGKLPPFEEAKDEIEQILTAQRVDNALDRWLGQARTQARMRYRDEVFK